MQVYKLMEKLLIKNIEGDSNLEIQDIEIDSRKVKPGALFICLPGLTVDGHRFASDAVLNGAVAVLTEKDIDLPSHITKIRVPDTRRAMAVLSNVFHGHPTSKLNVIGVTGTNGKTTTTHIIEKILNDNSKKTGLIGTIQMRFGEYTEKTNNTTPEAIELQRYFKKILDQGAEYAVLEVSSHALDMGRVRGCNFKSTIFTNLTHDHLDYHDTMDQYLETKSLLFSQLGNTYDERPKFAILNTDDEVSNLFAKKTAAQVITYGIHHKADVQARNMEITSNGTSFVVDTFKGSIPLKLKLNGTFNVYNSLAAVSACLVEDIPLEQIKTSLETFEGVRGRFERVEAGQDFTVIVDYAHNPDGLQNVLKTAKNFTDGRLFCIVGCEGDRDRKKRPVMANIAVDYSDYAILTSDNTRSEEPEDILKEMSEGLKSKNIPIERYISIINRRDAIYHAIERAKPNDCIIITGKGHETRQIIKNNQSIPFDDREIVIECIKNKFDLPFRDSSSVS